MCPYSSTHLARTDSPRGKDRPFRRATVGPCHVQTATDRFGHEAKRAILDRERMSMSLDLEGVELPIVNWPPSDSEDSAFDNIPATSIYKLIPSTQPFRNNLTALSQMYNLYLAAYRSKIYAYVPRSVPRQTIPRHPDAQIGTSPSPAGYLIGGHIDPDAPHLINHLAVGVLGEEEVVVTCHDDGDVIAIYTKDIAEYILSKSTVPSAATLKQRRNPSPSAASRRKTPEPFFQENVGVSAWGIAIHQHSRLIAVSSNRSEVTVFAPALATREPQAQNCDCDSCCKGIEERVRRRARNWRIVIALGSLASNLPNISFVDDKYGNAEKVSAIDIKGAMWVADIWKPKQAAIRVMPSTSPLLKSEEFWPASSRGWGILVLANRYFLKVHSEEELLGAPLRDLEMVPKLQAGPHPMVNMARYIRNLPDNPCPQPTIPVPFSRLITANNAMPANMADDETVTDEPSDDGLEFDAVGQSDEAGDDGDEGEGDDDDDSDGNGEDEVQNENSVVDEPDNGSEVDEDEEEEEEEQNDDGNDLFYDMNAAGGVPLESGIPPEAANEQGEETMPAPVAEPPAAATIVDLVFQPAGNVDLPVSETAMFLQDLFTPFEGSQSFCGNTSTADNAEYSLASLRHDASAHLDMVYMPHSGEVCGISRQTTSLLRFLKRPVVYNENSQGHVSGLGKFAQRYYMLRMYEKDVELRTLDKPDEKGLPEYGILCPHALTMGLPPGRAWPPHFRGTSRLSMVIHIPELFLIVIGSPIGRVILATPTRLARPVEKWPGVLHHGLRLEWVLPRAADEVVFRTNKRPMHGMAVGPVQEDGVMGMGKGKEKQPGTVLRRYRLMLHYRNHDILTYELSREEQTGKVCIF